jgi:hypothetical protein
MGRFDWARLGLSRRHGLFGQFGEVIVVAGTLFASHTPPHQHRQNHATSHACHHSNNEFGAIGQTAGRRVWRCKQDLSAQIRREGVRAATYPGQKAICAGFDRSAHAPQSDRLDLRLWWLPNQSSVSRLTEHTRHNASVKEKSRGKKEMKGSRRY